MGEFQFTPDQIEDLKSWVHSLKTERAMQWASEEETAERETSAILNAEEFAGGEDLSAEQLDELFGHSAESA